MIERTTDSDLINRYLSDDPAFFRVKDAEKFKHVYFLHAPGIGVFPGILKGAEMHMHACVKPEKRGREAVKAAKQCIEWIFSNTPAQKVTTKAEKSKRHLRMFNALILVKIREDQKYAYYEVCR